MNEKMKIVFMSATHAFSVTMESVGFQLDPGNFRSEVGHDTAKPQCFVDLASISFLMEQPFINILQISDYSKKRRLYNL